MRSSFLSLQDKAARFASMVAAFCERLGWYDLEALIVKFQVRGRTAESGSKGRERRSWLHS